MSKKQPFLFEISWEVCNQVGGIYTVLKTKATQSVKKFGSHYICVGPLLERQSEFIEASKDSFWDTYKVVLDELSCDYRLGYWNIEGKPRVILIDFLNFYQPEKLLHFYWKRFQLDTFGAGTDVVHPIQFSSRSAEFIDTFSRHYLSNFSVSAHFHEWMMGAGILYLNANSSNVSSVFTTHATVLGRAYTASRKRINYQEVAPSTMAQELGVSIKHHIEALSALQADCFTCVSDVVAKECSLLLGVKPDFVVKNGINYDWFLKKRKSAALKQKYKQKLLKQLSEIFSVSFPKETQFWISSGRYEYENKGYDVLLDSLEALNVFLKEKDAAPLVFFVCPAVHSKSLADPLHKYLQNEFDEGFLTQQNYFQTHDFLEEHEDVFLKKLKSMDFINSSDSKIFVMYSPQFLNGHDGFYQLEYYDFLSYMDLSIFPSLYEPWGYTPQESSAVGVATLTSDTSGFAQWACHDSCDDGVGLITRSRDCYQTSMVSLSQQMQHYYTNLEQKSFLASVHKQCHKLMIQCDWSKFFKAYEQAYEFAAQHSRLQVDCADAIVAGQSKEASFFDHAQHNLNSSQDSLRYLNSWISNWWWSYDNALAEFFEKLHPKLWSHVEQNPFEFVELLDHQYLIKQLENEEIYDAFQYLKNHFEAQSVYNKSLIPKEFSIDEPIAYFSMEFGISSFLPTYSGGLGVLAGDILKGASDMHYPMVGISLLYRSGYFNQQIAYDGYQRMRGMYLSDQDLNRLRLKPVFSSSEYIRVNLFGRPVYLQSWILQVGRSTLYFLDSDVEENAVEDRSITHKLYPSCRTERLKQEIILGFAGAKLLQRLEITPKVFHMNEGHSAFLSLKRVSDFLEKGFSKDDAMNIVKSSTCFTTHTSVAAGLEAFSPDLVQDALCDFWDNSGLDFNSCLSLAKHEKQSDFSLTVLAFNMSSRYNSVSQLHCKLANELWSHLSVIKKQEILNVTNAIHANTWVGKHMKAFYQHLDGDSHLLPKFKEDSNFVSLWQAHSKQKNSFLEAMVARVQKEYSHRYAEFSHIYDLVRSLENHPEWLTIGFARRFATYKQADLILENPLWLKRLLSMGVRIVFAGKAHPADVEGQLILQKIYNLSCQDGFSGHVYVLENYDMSLAAKMVQGVDLWLNNPIFGKEASGTSGMKAALNGVLNLSVADGWWHEAYHEKLGWSIFSEQEYPDEGLRRRQYSTHLYTLLEKEIIPMYYKGYYEHGFSELWLEKMVSCMKILSQGFSAQRMMRDYYKEIYKPIIKKVKSDILINSPKVV